MPNPNWDYPDPFTIRLVALPEHIDGLNHVNNAVYVSWCEQAGWEHSRSLGLAVSDYKALDRAMAITDARYQYLQAAGTGDELQLATWLTHCDGRLRLERRFQLWRSADDAVLMRGVWQLACICISTGKPKRMPEPFVRCYGEAVVAVDAV